MPREDQLTQLLAELYDRQKPKAPSQNEMLQKIAILSDSAQLDDSSGLITTVQDPTTFKWGGTGIDPGWKWGRGQWKTVVRVSDGFSRADNPSTLGNAETGQAWQALTGTWGTISGTAYCAVSSGSFDYVILDSGLSDCAVQVKLTVTAGWMYLLIRATDSSNHLAVEADRSHGTYKLFKKVAGTYSLIGAYSAMPVSGDVLRVVARGTQLQICLNDNPIIVANETFNRTARKHGLGVSSAALARFDDFRVEIA